ncbi:hypothetical protein [Leptospirillum ferrooxidans]|uniref:Uncharacterized protein n=1 Tax=Leptospirillum ferrooxidans (strain C2-3) TaxID=1162668 RepID=I0IM25_LEPFC|nr:hypothetical protein [Leptospirillum ferrooxidans]BAM06324.1 hypothetical protein LFE_0608 [Leptospirillum ferrooxidans C2-3]
MRKILVGFLSVLMIFPGSIVSMAAQGQSPATTTAPSPQSQSVTSIQNQLNSDLVSSSTTPPPTPSQGGGYQSVPAGTAPNNCAAQPILNAMAGAQSGYLNTASRAVSKHQGVMQALASQLDVCSQNFLKFAFGLSSSLPGWSAVLDQIVTMACSMAGQAVYDALMCLINGALYGALTGKPFGFCGGYVMNATMSGGMNVNPSTGQLQLSGTGSTGNSSFTSGVSGNATPNIGTSQSSGMNNSTYNAGGNYTPGQGIQNSTSGGSTGSGQSIGPGGGVTGTIQKLFQ